MLTTRERRHRLTLQRPIKTKNEIGETVESWEDVITVMGRRTNRLRNTAEAVAAGSEVAAEVVQFDILPRAIDHTWRIVSAGRIYEIKSAGTDNDNGFTSIIVIGKDQVAV